jgi:signal transduction histidine kinase
MQLVGGVRYLSRVCLWGLTDRIETLGGRLMVDSVPGRGTRLAAEIPLGGEAL